MPKKKSKTKVSKKRNHLPFLLGVLIILIAGIFLTDKFLGASHQKKVQTEISALQQELINSATTYLPDYPDIKVKFSGNKTVEYGDLPQDPYKPFGTVTFVGQAVLVDDTAVSTIAINSGGSGEFFYLISLKPSNGGWEMTSSQPLGDRIDLQSVKLDGKTIKVDFKDHGPEQAMVDAPNVQVHKVYEIVDGTLQEKE